MLEVTALRAAYGRVPVVFDISFSVGEAEVVTLLGRNGMGKTTTIRAIMGLLPPAGGQVRIAGRDLTGAPPFRIARAGLGLVPEGRQVFPTLTVRENLIATARPGAWNLPRVLALFPRLAERHTQPARLLSGGEQQMLAIGRAMMTNPRLLILDEATEGLAPKLRAEIWTCLAALKREGLAILVIDKNFANLRALADRHVIIEKGRVAWNGDSAGLAADASLLERYLHI